MSDSEGAKRWPNGPTRFEQRFGNNLTRIVVAVIGIPLVLGLIYLGGWWFVGFITAIGMGALLEFYWMIEAKGIKPAKTIGLLSGLLFFLGSGALIVGEIVMSKEHFLFIWVLLVALTLMMLISSLAHDKNDALESLLGTLGGFYYVPLLLSTLIFLNAFVPMLSRVIGGDSVVVPDHTQFYFFMILLAGIWICDSGAYFGGRAFGKHKLFERVSPKKTWEGAITGALSAIIALAFLLPWGVPGLTLVDGIVVGLIVGVFGQIGDLVESHIKRACGIKDSSQLIPGHGGILDRFDSLLFVAPITFVYFIFRLFLTSP